MFAEDAFVASADIVLLPKKKKWRTKNMIKVDCTEVFGWQAALRGMRNPLASHHLSDSKITGNNIVLGENDLKLAQKLIKAGTDHRKFLRFITVTFDLTAPLYMLKEFDTYKVGTVCNSYSTMHKIHSRDLTENDFSSEHLDTMSRAALNITISEINKARQYYMKNEDPDRKKFWWWQMIQLLPSSYNQKRTYLMNYEVLRNMYFARRNHKLDEWHDFCRWIESLPYAKELICLGESK